MKEKAKELYLRFLLKLPFDGEVLTENKHGKWTYDSEQLAKEHALIAVQFAFDTLGEQDSPYTTLKQRQELTQIKFEIEKL